MHIDATCEAVHTHDVCTTTPTVQLAAASVVDQVFLSTVQRNSNLHCHRQGSEEDLSLPPTDCQVLLAQDGPAAALLLEQSAVDHSACEYLQTCLYTITQTVFYNYLILVSTCSS